MIMTYEDFSQKLNKKLFIGSSRDLLEKIVNNPDRYVGVFRPTKPKTKLIQNITQSHEIKFGDALESIFEDYFSLTGFKLLPKRLKHEDSEELNVDQLFMDNDTVYLIEQKIRDDHDSSKKRGQFINFENKYRLVSKLYPSSAVIPIMWFVDSSLVKNKRYYLDEMNRMNNAYGCTPKLCYGKELFTTGIDGADIEIWDEVLRHLKKWKQTLPDMPKVNFDEKADEVFEEIKDIKPAVFEKMFKNTDITEQILPVLFPQKNTLVKLKAYFDTKSERGYRALCVAIQGYIDS